jgi:hypothetical protein
MNGINVHSPKLRSAYKGRREKGTQTVSALSGTGGIEVQNGTVFVQQQEAMAPWQVDVELLVIGRRASSIASWSAK